MKKEVRTVVYDDELRIYIYVVPVIAVVTSVVVLHEKITALAAVGTVLTLADPRNIVK